ncbi:MAG TPA: histidine phosphatase family protein [Rhizomicrobium sp.]|jgi:probable phosphoglycerate mutase
MPGILLIPHAEHTPIDRSLLGHDDFVRLSEAGRAQARALVNQLVGEPIVCIQSSPRLRCLETADALAEALDLPVMIEPALSEGNTGVDAQARVCKHLEDTRRRYRNGDVVMITHVEIIRAALLRFGGGLPHDWRGFDIPPASIIRLELEPLRNQRPLLSSGMHP